jgi:hypothetical protein
MNVNEVAPPIWSIVRSLDDTRALQPALKRESGPEAILTRVKSGESHARHTDESRFLRKYLNIAQRVQQVHVFSCQIENLIRSFRK